MQSVFKSARCEVEFQMDHDEGNRGGYVCYGCLIACDNWDGNTRVANVYEAIKHLQDHVANGHMVPQSVFIALKEDLAYQTIVHQSGMSPLRRHDGSLSAKREKAFHDQWRKEQEEYCSDGLLKAHLRNLDMLPMTQRDATLAATLMQWLGTNVGWCFMENVLKRCGYKIVKDEEK